MKHSMTSFQTQILFFQQAVNKAYPDAGVMETGLEMLVDRTDVDEGVGIKLDLIQCNINHGLQTLLENEGDTWQERK